jgi:hypothetical protein
MPRYIRNTALLAKIETTEGVDSVPTGAANAMLISDVTVNPLNAQNVSRDLIRPYFGGSEQLVGTAYVELSFTVELAGSGTAATPAAWGALVRACGFVETATTFVAYTPATPAAQASCTIHYHDDGLRHVLLGAKGSFRVGLGVGERPTLQFTFLGRDGGVSAIANPTTTLTAWRQPAVVTDTNSGDVTLGGAYAAGAVTGGTAYTSRGLALDLGNDVQFTPLLGGEYIDVTAREVTGQVQFDLTPAQEVTFMGSVKANTLQTMSLQHGSAAGSTVLVHMAAAQLINPSKQDINGRRLIGFDVRGVPVAGNDDLIIVTK